MSKALRRILLALGGLATAAAFVLGAPTADAAVKPTAPICVYIEP